MGQPNTDAKATIIGFGWGVVCTSVFLAIMWFASIFDLRGDIACDVSKRLRPPDNTKTTFLVSRNGGSKRILVIENLSES